MPKKIFVLIIAITSSVFDNFFVNICVTITIPNMKIIIVWSENMFNECVIIKNQNDNPALTAKDLNLGDDNSI